MLMYASFFSVHILLKKKNGHRYVIILKLIGPITSWLLNSQKISVDQVLYNFLTMINYDLLFMTQGCVDTFFQEELDKCYREFSRTPMSLLAFIYWGINQGLFLPLGAHN